MTENKTVRDIRDGFVSYLEKRMEWRRNLVDGVGCGHTGCLSHVSHPCEKCGRIAGRFIDWQDASTNNQLEDK